VEIRDVAVLAAHAASDKKATDIMVIDVAQLLVVTEYFVICTGNTDIQVRAIADEVEDRVREDAGMKPIGREGAEEGKWVLLDYGDFVVHVFQPEERGFYRLEKLWGDAPRVALPADVAASTSASTAERDEAEADAEIAASRGHQEEASKADADA
jgi:ribosome-associated protein